MARAFPLLAVLALCTALLGCGGEDVDLERDAVEVRVARVALDARTDSPVVILEESAGPRRLPIWIGVPEATSIANELESNQAARPNAHDLAKRLIDGLEGSVSRVVVTHLSEGVYYATIVLAHDGESVNVDSRPSDAIAIALRYHAPLFVHESLFVQALEASGADSGKRI
jgi:bifunctional DNase/RNase